MESVLEGFAEYYSAELAVKVNRGMTENALKCKFNGGLVPFGYKIDEQQHYQIDPVTAPIVREIFADYANGKTIKSIVNCVRRFMYNFPIILFLSMLRKMQNGRTYPTDIT